MKELLEYRTKLIQRVAGAARDFRAACEAAADPFAPAEEGGWNVHQLASHTRDVDKFVYGLRARRTLSEEDPTFQSFNADEWMAAHYDQSEPLTKILDEFTHSIENLVKELPNLPPEAWGRESRHETLGAGFTAQIWVERGLAHVEEHLASVKRLRRTS